jgi:hypothetical protein
MYRKKLAISFLKCGRAMAIEDLKNHMNLAHLLFNIAKKYVFLAIEI